MMTPLQLLDPIPRFIPWGWYKWTLIIAAAVLILWVVIKLFYKKSDDQI